MSEQAKAPMTREEAVTRVSILCTLLDERTGWVGDDAILNAQSRRMTDALRFLLDENARLAQAPEIMSERHQYSANWVEMATSATSPPTAFEQALQEARAELAEREKAIILERGGFPATEPAEPKGVEKP